MGDKVVLSGPLERHKETAQEKHTILEGFDLSRNLLVFKAKTATTALMMMIKHSDPEMSLVPEQPVVTDEEAAAPTSVLPLDDAVMNDGHRRRSKNLCFMLGILVTALLAAGAMTAVIMVGKDDDDDNAVSHGSPGRGNDNNDVTADGTTHPPAPISAVPKSGNFSDPTTVRWTRRGQILRDDLAVSGDIPADATDEYAVLPGRWGLGGDLRGDGRLLTINTQDRGYVLLYSYDADADEWLVVTKLQDPTVVPRRGEEEEGEGGTDIHDMGEMTIAMKSIFSGNGKYLSVEHNRGEDLDYRTFTYTHDNSEEPPDGGDKWVLDNGDTPFRVPSVGRAWDYDGTHYALGNPTTVDNAGEIVVYTRRGGEWQQEGRVEGLFPFDKVGLFIRMSWDAMTLVSANPFRDVEPGKFRAGTVFTWKRAFLGGEWTMVNVFPGAALNAMFGNNVHLSGNGQVMGVLNYKGEERVSVYDFVVNGEEEDASLGAPSAGTWVRRAPIGIKEECLHCNFCLSADGDFVAFASHEIALAFQYQPSSNGDGDMEWVQVGSFPGPFGEHVYCSHDGRVVMLGHPTVPTLGTTPGEPGKFSVWEAVESKDI